MSVLRTFALFYMILRISFTNGRLGAAAEIPAYVGVITNPELNDPSFNPVAFANIPETPFRKLPAVVPLESKTAIESQTPPGGLHVPFSATSDVPLVLNNPVSNSLPFNNSPAASFSSPPAVQTPVAKSVFQEQTSPAVLQVPPTPLDSDPVLNNSVSHSLSATYSPNLPDVQFISEDQMRLPGQLSPTNNNGIPDLAQSFAEDFIQRVQSDSKLNNAFTHEGLKDAESAANMYHKLAILALNVVGVKDAEPHARTISEAVKSNFEKAGTESVIPIYANATGKYLFAQGALTRDNIANLSRELVEKLRDAVYSVVNPSPEDNYQNIQKGFLNFLVPKGLFSPDNAPLGVVYFANEWHKL